MLPKMSHLCPVSSPRLRHSNFFASLEMRSADVRQARVSVTSYGRGCCATRVAKLRAIFSGLAFLSIIINLDGGAVPAALLHIERTFELSTAEVGVLGMLVYEGIAIGSLFVGPLLSCFSAVRATQLTLFLNTGATLAFGASRRCSDYTLKGTGVASGALTRPASSRVCDCAACSTAMLLVFRVSIGLLQVRAQVTDASGMARGVARAVACAVLCRVKFGMVWRDGAHCVPFISRSARRLPDG